MIYKLQPILKHRLWGGKNLAKLCHVTSQDKIGEAWILSCIDENNSPISKDKTLLDLFKKNPEIVAKNYRGKFPLLIKLIDAQKDLSIQVHPRIKTEFWHVLNKKPSKLFMGFDKNTDKISVNNLLKTGKITSILNNISVKNGGSYLIEPGTIHAIGKKTFLIEIQQSADVTYRLYDYNRVDSNGKHRPLHIKQALGCINYKKYKISKHKSNNHLVSCPFFNVYKHSIKDHLTLNASDKSFHAVVVLNGHGSIKCKTQTIKFKPYETFFIPAGSGKYEIVGKSTVVVSTL